MTETTDIVNMDDRLTEEVTLLSTEASYRCCETTGIGREIITHA